MDKSNEENNTNNPPQLIAALAYAAKGWHVFPVHSISNGKCTCGKQECEHAGKHPRTQHGLHDTTIDPETIKRWWAFAWPDANIGIATGEVSGIVVLDIDPRHGGDKSLAEIEERFGRLPNTLRSKTGGGGWHFFFRHPGHYVKSITIMPGVDIKADGGYAVAPPSLHISGKSYEWEEEE
jgi:hypothetical protein